MTGEQRYRRVLAAYGLCLHKSGGKYCLTQDGDRRKPRRDAPGEWLTGREVAALAAELEKAEGVEL